MFWVMVNNLFKKAHRVECYLGVFVNVMNVCAMQHELSILYYTREQHLRQYF